MFCWKESWDIDFVPVRLMTDDCFFWRCLLLCALIQSRPARLPLALVLEGLQRHACMYACP